MEGFKEHIAAEWYPQVADVFSRKSTEIIKEEDRFLYSSQYLLSLEFFEKHIQHTLLSFPVLK